MNWSLFLMNIRIYLVVDFNYARGLNGAERLLRDGCGCSKGLQGSMLPKPLVGEGNSST